MGQLSNMLFLIKNSKKSLEFDKKSNPTSFVENAFRIARKWSKGGWMRNSITWHIKDIRSRFPYKVIDYSEAKKMYEEYFAMEGNLISFNRFKCHLLKQKQMKESVFIYCFRDDVPVKGNKPGKFYINGMCSNTGLVLEVAIEASVIKSRACNQSDWQRFPLPFKEDSITQYLYATSDQIKDFYRKRDRYQFLRSLQKNILEDLKAVNEKIDTIDDFYSDN